jgi:DNA helicase HerA-like ATPase
MKGQGSTYPTLLVLEEAHHYLRTIINNDAVVADALAYERLAKEGRKFGLSMWISTQRPSELSSTVLSQCGTWICFRTAGQADMNAIGAATEWLDKRELTAIAGLPRQQAIFFGAGVPLPTRIIIPNANPKPRSHDPKYSKWTQLPAIIKPPKISKENELN